MPVVAAVVACPGAGTRPSAAMNGSGHDDADAQALRQVARILNLQHVRPVLGDRSTERVYADEFGSLTTDAEWAVEEMFGAALRERFPTGLPQGARYTLDTGFGPPAMPFDLIIDLRVLKNQGESPLGGPATAMRG